jgi:hypothetical protein
METRVLALSVTDRESMCARSMRHQPTSSRRFGSAAQSHEWRGAGGLV